MHTGKDASIQMELYKRLVLTYINKYHRLDLTILTKELRMTEYQIAELVSSLRNDGYVSVENQCYEVSEKGKDQVFPVWNEWSVFVQEEREKKQQEFEWDYLYIPEKMV